MFVASRIIAITILGGITVLANTYTKKAMSIPIAFFNLSDFPTMDFRLISVALQALLTVLLVFAGMPLLMRHLPHGDLHLG